MGRPGNDVRPAQGNFRASPAPADELLRPQPGRPARHPRDDRRGRAERPLCLGRRGDAQRFRAALRPGDLLALLALLSRLGHAFAAAVHGRCSPISSAITCAMPTAAFARPSRASTASCRSTSAAWRSCSSSTASANPASSSPTFNRIHMEAYKDAIDAFSFFFPGVEFLSMGGIALVYWVGGLRVDRRHARNRRARVVHAYTRSASSARFRI